MRTSTGIDPKLVDGLSELNTNEDDDDHAIGVSPPRSRRNGAGQKELILALKAEGQFATKQKIGDIRIALARKGQTFKSTDNSPILVKLTKDGDLKRDHDPDNRWIYYAE
jgi:hypothetical protein